MFHKTKFNFFATHIKVLVAVIVDVTSLPHQFDAIFALHLSIKVLSFELLFAKSAV